eukprot:CAMPEP_0174841750 /NCGR_PEP_ID=MMETSP1114-20130205/9507_1 /TAXON_ID=312471 /ORGANISM="Neobodo designis, Strain CCAP 1951/1" /LENGTH=248 /DNA_ID=CAMNT_0016075943 /DNA_START=466 /DNA_END=1209 /DNA_ORIENTATION=-
MREWWGRLFIPKGGRVAVSGLFMQTVTWCKLTDTRGASTLPLHHPGFGPHVDDEAYIHSQLFSSLSLFLLSGSGAHSRSYSCGATVRGLQPPSLAWCFPSLAETAMVSALEVQRGSAAATVVLAAAVGASLSPSTTSSMPATGGCFGPSGTASRSGSSHSQGTGRQYPSYVTAGASASIPGTGACFATSATGSASSMPGTGSLKPSSAGMCCTAAHAAASRGTLGSTSSSSDAKGARGAPWLGRRECT